MRSIMIRKNRKKQRQMLEKYMRKEVSEIKEGLKQEIFVKSQRVCQHEKQQ